MPEPSPLLSNGYGSGEGKSCCLQNRTDHPNLPPATDKPSSEMLAESNISDSGETSLIPIDDDNEPLGYLDFLCDVNIEYSPGGHLSSSDGNRHCFKMKYLPYMVQRNSCRSDETNSSHSLSDCSLRDEDNCASELRMRPIDVTKTTCAFLGNSEYVPNQKFAHRRVVLEMISAKMSQSTTFNVPATNNHINLFAKPERRPSVRGAYGSGDLDNASITSSSLDCSLYENQNGGSNSQHTSSPMTSKKFVNYTILIKTAPGLDSHPAVIERRFSDFLQLNQGLKKQPNLANIVDEQVTFPKKVYMGNFSLANIAERSIVFAKLLDVCMTNSDILWSGPFISFLLDKELNEAHRLSLCGDPEDVQALIETVYYIEKKIYFGWISSSKFGESSNTTPNSLELPSNGEPRNCYTPSLPKTRTSSVRSPLSDETTLSAESIGSNTTVDHSPASTVSRSSPSGGSLSDCGDCGGRDDASKISSALSQRVLVTFCILILTYYRGENHSDLKLAIHDFSQLVSSRDFVESVSQTRHFLTLRACLLFLMNINRGNVIDDNQRYWLKRRLEDIDGAYADSDGSNDVISPYRGRTVDTNVCRVTKGDLASMLRERNFCSFRSDNSSR